MSEEIVKIILTSSVVASVIAAFVSTWIGQRKISIENITQEQTKWREKIRKKSLEVHIAIINKEKVALEKLHAEFSLIVNPKKDIDILNCIKLPEKGKEIDLSNEFISRVSLLLKHDWERVKKEAGPLFCRIVCIGKLCDWLTFEPKIGEYKN